MEDPSKAVEETAKAVQETAKATQKGIEATQAFGGFISKYIGGSLEQATGIIEDKLKYHRWERQIRLMDRANQFLAERGMSQPTRLVPLKFIVPLLQGASLEENDDLQDRWAALLVNAADGSRDIEIRRGFISILEDLQPLDALIFDRIYDVTFDREAEAGSFGGFWTKCLPSRVTTQKPSEKDLKPSFEVEISMTNLGRLGLLRSAIFYGGGANFYCVYRTPLGLAFREACKHEKDTA
jgi:hypothetical protein